MGIAVATNQPGGIIAELLCSALLRSMLVQLTWPVGFEVGSHSPCPDCRRVAADACGLYVPFDRREHDIHRLAAEHEAGHVVANLLYGNTVEAVDLGQSDPDDWVTGDATVTVRSPNLGSRAITTWAGTLAHREGLRRRGLLHRNNVIGCVRTSRADAEWLLSNTTAPESATAQVVARDLVAEHWARIDRLAEALRAAGRMTGAEVDAALK